MRKPNQTLLQAIHSNVEHIVWPPVTVGPQAVLLGLLQQLETSQWLSPDTIAGRQGEQLAKLVAHSWKYSPYFRTRLEQSGIRAEDIVSLDALKAVPVLTRADIQQAGPALYCQAVPQSHLPLHAGKSSGSTGEPVTVRKTAVNQLFWQANMMREHFWHQRDFKGRLLVIRSGIKEPLLQKGWGVPADLLVSTGDTMGLPITFSVEKHLKAILSFRPQHLNIHPGTLDALITLCQKENIRIEGVEHIWCISETLSPELRKKAGAFFGASIEDDYSTNELGIVALQCPQSGLYHAMAESLIVELLDEKGNHCTEGQIGRVVVTDLHNFATPLIRYELGDYAQAGGVCPCGRGLPVINSIKGRNRNLVVKPDGSRHWPTLTTAIFLSRLPITRFQLIQHSVENIEVRLVTERKFNDTEETALKEQLYLSLNHKFNLELVYFDGHIPLPASGKFEDFICRV